MQTLTDSDFQVCATELGISLAAIKAIVEVEAAGEGFLSDGRPKILFEAHWFSKFTNGKFDQTYPSISSAQWNRKLYLGGEKEYDRLNAAINLDREAALKSASWGMFQIMGFNYSSCGFSDVSGFVEAQKEVKFQLASFTAFLKNNPSMIGALGRQDWAKFAFLYNGPSYRTNLYDVQIQQAYQNFNKTQENCSHKKSAIFQVAVENGSWMKYDDKVQVSAITDEKLKHFVGYKTRIPVKDWQLNQSTKHYQVELDEEMKIKDRNTWFLYAPHYSIQINELPLRVNLPVSYLSQLDNANRPRSTCNVTSVAMCLKFFGINGQGEKQLEDELYETCQSKGLDIFTHIDLVKLFQLYGIEDRFSTTASWQQVKEHLASGNPVIISALFTKSGHIIVLRGYDEEGFWVNDPYGEYFLSGYRTDLSGENLHYSYNLLNRVSYGGAISTWAHFPEKVK